MPSDAHTSSVITSAVTSSGAATTSPATGTIVSEHGISLDRQVLAHDPRSVQGLLGPNSAPWSYLRLPDGTMMRHASSNDQIVGAYADGWRVADSLFEHHHSPL